MKKIIFACAAVLALQTIRAQVKEERHVSGFTSICAGSAIKVIVTLGEKESLAFEAEETVISKLKAEVKNNALFISCKGNCDSKKEMVAYVSVKELKGIIANEAAAVKVTSTLHAATIAVAASGAASVDLNVETDELKAVAEGASTISAKGHAQKLNVIVKGASAFKGKDIAAANVDVMASGASSAKCNVVESLRAMASGASSIIYSGEPKDVKTDVQEASTVKKAS